MSTVRTAFGMGLDEREGGGRGICAKGLIIHTQLKGRAQISVYVLQRGPGLEAASGIRIAYV